MGQAVARKSLPSALDMGSVNRLVLRVQFTAAARQQIYESLGVLIDNNVMMLTALNDLYMVASREGARPKTAEALILAEVIEKLSTGKSLATAIAPWASGAEVSIIAAGEEAGQLRQAFQDAIGLLNSQKRIRGAALSLAAYPSVLGVMVVAVLIVISLVVVPKLAGIADPQSWEGFAKILYMLSEAVIQHGVYSVLVVIPLIVFTVWSLPNYTGRARYYLDQIPPWSLYRMIQGATFMLNLSVMLRSGVKLHDALVITEGLAKPWLKQRVAGAISGTSVGRNFGEALADSGYGFPDPASIRYIRTLAGLDGFDKGLNDYAIASMARTITKIERAAKALLLLAISVIVVFVLLVVGAISDIQSAIDSSINY